MRFSQAYITCWLLDDFLSILGQICRGYKENAKLERHGTSFHPSSTRWRRAIRSLGNISIQCFSFHQMCSFLRQCRPQIFCKSLIIRHFLAHFPCIYLVSLNHAFYHNALGIDRYGCCSWTCTIASYRWSLVSSISTRPWMRSNIF